MGLAALKAPEWLSDPGVQGARRDVIEAVRFHREMGWDNFPPEEQKEAMDRARKKYRGDMAALDQEIAMAWHKERNASITFNWWGLGFVFFGSVFQGIAIVLGTG
ncbi:hypothetical protein MUNTM_01960 [Mycobacterium sp. MUNTM1]